jgi:hypothetical protein
MMKVGVLMSGQLDDVGEYLADARALDTAGADSLWIDGEGEAPWLILAAMSTVTSQARLVAPIFPADRQSPADFAARVATLNRLSRGRVVLRIAVSDAGAHADAAALLALARSSAKCPAFLELGPHDQPELPVEHADGLIAFPDTASACRATFETAQRRRSSAAPDSPFALWARADFPAGREEWRRTRADYEAAGATGILVPADPRLLDLLRNPDDEDDRSDLMLAQG